LMGIHLGVLDVSTRFIDADCQKFLAGLSEVVGGAAPVEVAQDALSHRAGCSPCEAEYLLASEIEKSLTSLPEFSPGALFARVDQRLAEASGAPEIDFTIPVDLGLSCEEFREVVGDLVNGELSMPMQADCAEHVGACVTCRGALAETEVLEATMRSLPETAPPAGMWDRFLRRLADESPRLRVRGRRPVALSRYLAPVLTGDSDLD